MTAPVDLERLAGLLCVELRIASPSLNRVVMDAVRDAHGRALPGGQRAQFLANAIEDGLGAAGEGLHRLLSPDAQDDWQGIVARALSKAMRRA